MHQHKGDNLYPAKMDIEAGDFKLTLDVPEGVWNPTPHGLFLGEMIATELDFSGADVLELGCGSGNHTILMAKRGAKSILATELSEEVLKNTRHNLDKHDVKIPVDLKVADWTNVPGGPFDVLISNPPFAKSGKRYYRYFIDTLILEAHKLLKPGGRLIFIQSSMANNAKSIKMMEDWGMQVCIVGKSQHPFRQYYYEDPRFMKMIESVPGGYSMIDGKEWETLTVWEAKWGIPKGE